MLDFLRSNPTILAKNPTRIETVATPPLFVLSDDGDGTLQMQFFLAGLALVGDVANVEIGAGRAVHFGQLALAVPLDERVFSVMKNIAPTVENHGLGTRNE